MEKKLFTSTLIKINCKEAFDKRKLRLRQIKRPTWLKAFRRTHPKVLFENHLRRFSRFYTYTNFLIINQERRKVLIAASQIFNDKSACSCINCAKFYFVPLIVLILSKYIIITHRLRWHLCYPSLLQKSEKRRVKFRDVQKI